MVNILISNDDGVDAPGILAAKQAIEDLANVTVVAPMDENSGVGRSLTVFKPLKIKYTVLNDGGKAYGISGTPADSVSLGIHHILNEKPDLVIAGINKGQNICRGELTSSGTVSAALEAASHGVPAIAVSLSIDPSSVEYVNGKHILKEPLDFSFAGKILAKVSKKVLNKGLPEGVDLLNLNVPSNPISDEIKVSKLAKKMFNTSIIEKEDKFGEKFYILAPELVHDFDKGTDGYCLRVERCSSLTPLKLDLTGNIANLKDW